MKTRFFGSWLVVLMLAGAPLLIAGVESWVTSERAEGRELTPESVLMAAVAADPDLQPLPPDGTVEEPSAAGTTEAAPPAPSLNLTPATSAIVKLAQSGTSEEVMRAFAKSMTNHFSLGSDEIVYLNDLGIPGSVIKDMIEHDAALRGTGDLPLAAYDGRMPTNTNPATIPAAVEMGAQPVSADETYAPNYTDYNADYYTNPDGGTEYFYDSLAPYGTWVDVNGYGRCWQPTVYVVNPTWQPYCDRGRWVDTDCGWYWQSDYSWGWAAFHFGRWFQDDHHGWLWRPDHVWGPAWVSWRHSTDYCGWAPLPPGSHFRPGVGWQYGNRTVGVNFEFGLKANQYTFVPTRHFGDYAPGRYRLAPTQSGRTYNQTVVFNHVTFENNHLINHGVDPKRVENSSPGGLRRAVIRDLPADRGVVSQPDRLQKSGDNMVVYRPHLPPSGAKSEGDHTTPRRGGTPAIPVATNPSGIVAGPKTGHLRSPAIPTTAPAAEPPRDFPPKSVVPVFTGQDEPRTSRPTGSTTSRGGDTIGATRNDSTPRGPRPVIAPSDPAAPPGNQRVYVPSRTPSPTAPANPRPTTTASPPDPKPAPSTSPVRQNPTVFNRPTPIAGPQPVVTGQPTQMPRLQPGVGRNGLPDRTVTPVNPTPSPGTLPARVAPESPAYRPPNFAPASSPSMISQPPGRVPPAFVPPSAGAPSPAAPPARNQPAYSPPAVAAPSVNPGGVYVRPSYTPPSAPAPPAYHAPAVESRPAPAPVPAAPAASANANANANSQQQTSGVGTGRR